MGDAGYFCGAENFMSVIFLLLTASILIAALFLLAFLWSVKKGQYDDQQSPPVRMLFDDKPSNNNQ
jgi:cbb3-type cytochrome oxidase maturation protein